jgi:branched-chain amino acid aminotransferase
MLALTFDRSAWNVDLGRSDARHGYGLFETVRVQDGAARWLPHHVARLAAGCAFLGLPPPPGSDELAARLAAPLRELGAGALHLVAADGLLRARWGAAPPAPALPARIALATSVVRHGGSPGCRFKTLSYLDNRLLQREAEARGLFDAVALNERGRLADGGRTNVFLVLGGAVVTPPEADGALPGVARRVLLEAGLAEERSLAPEELETAEGVFVANALRGVVAVRVDPGGRVAGCAAALR